MKRIFTLLVCLAALLQTAWAQQNVTDKYIENPDFEARFAAWSNPGKFTYQITDKFENRNGAVWMEKWVSQSSTLGTNSGMYQTLRNLPKGTYTLVAGAKNIAQANLTKKCTGAFLYAGTEKVEVSAAGDYTVVFTVANGKADIGMRLQNCNGNWVCLDNIRLYYNGENADSLAKEQARVDEELSTLQTRLASPTGSKPTVKTNAFVPTGTTLALGRLTVTGTCKEKGFCWSTKPDPTILDERSTETFPEDASIYIMRGLKPATIYYVRAYALTSGYQVAYGDVVKIATLRKGVMAYGYDMAGDDEQDARINSASAECIWMYNALSYIPGFYLNVHYVYGAGAGDGTADCSYGGWMRVSQKTAYQQTGTILHETNHGVGVGTTNEWYNNANLRAETSRGLWLGPRATEMVRFFENNETATMTGDNTHMWPYGINGAQEDSYQPSSHKLYFANILITHAMHQDGLICSKEAGFAMPAYVFEQDDEVKYYIKNENTERGGLTSYLGMTATGGLTCYEMSADDVKENDNCAWKITFDPATSLYKFYNIGRKRTLSIGGSQNIHLMPSRETLSAGSYKGCSFWMLSGSNHQALRSTGTYSTQAATWATGATNYDASNAATDQRWMLLTADELTEVETGAIKNLKSELTEIIAHIRQNMQTPHVANNLITDVNACDATLADLLSEKEQQMGTFNSPSQFKEATNEVVKGLQEWLSLIQPTSMEKPIDLTWMLKNPDFAKDNTGWSETPAYGYACCEYFQKTFNFNQSTPYALPKGTYGLKVQAFQRPGSYANVYTDYVTNGTDNVTARLYANGSQQPLLNIYAEAKTQSPGAGSVNVEGVYIPDNMQSAATYFGKGWYENTLTFATSGTAPITVGLSCQQSANGYWTCFDNFRLYYYEAAALTTEGADYTSYIQNADCSAIEGWKISGGNNFKLNTWSTENDASGIKTPFIEDWRDKNSGKLTNATISHNTVTGMPAGSYILSGFIRMYDETGKASPKGATLYANEGTLDLSADGIAFTYNSSQGIYNTYALPVTVGLDGKLDFGIKIESANFNWISFKNFRLTYVAPYPYEPADLDGSGEVTFRDLPLLIRMLQLLPNAPASFGNGDVNQDGKTDIEDIKALEEKLLEKDSKL